MRMDVALVLLGAVLNALAQIALKASVHGQPPMRSPHELLAAAPRLLTSPMFLLALALYGISVLNWLIVLSRVELSVAYPAMSIAYVLTFIAGVVAFGEQATPVRIIGACAIVLGAVLISRPATPAA
jgi:multidrug transporter EmrE-like cation transporter